MRSFIMKLEWRCYKLNDDSMHFYVANVGKVVVRINIRSVEFRIESSMNLTIFNTKFEFFSVRVRSEIFTQILYCIFSCSDIECQKNVSVAGKTSRESLWPTTRKILYRSENLIQWTLELTYYNIFRLFDRWRF